MSRKKLEVIELNKKKNKILLAEEQSPLILFFRKHSVLIYLTSLILSLSIISFSVIAVMQNLNKSETPMIKETSVDVSLADYEVTTGSEPMTEEYAQNSFLNGDIFKHKGEIVLVKKVENSKSTVFFYSDGTAIRITKDNKVTRINPLTNGEYGIREDGTISSEAKPTEVTITNTKDYTWGTVRYLSDGSAIISNAKIDTFARNSGDIKDNYISNNIIAYPKDTKTIGSTKIITYTDGTIEVIKNNKSYVVRNEEDLNITDNDVTFNNNNEATIYKTIKTDERYTIDYYTDGGAIIRDGSKTMSVRKNNSIILKDNKIYEIVDNIYVEVSDNKNGVTYYTNGGAVVDNYNGNKVYVDENSNIKYQNNSISSIAGDTEKLTDEKTLGNENTKTFEKTAVVKTDDYIAIIPKDKVIFNPDGKVKEIADNNPSTNVNEFSITNNTNEKIKYRVVLEQSSKTNLNVEYIRFQMTSKDKYVAPSKLKDVLWQSDYVSKELGVTGTNYILIENTLEAYDTDNISLMLWTDYDTIPNSEQNKYFYGTIRVYAWNEIEK